MKRIVLWGLGFLLVFVVTSSQAQSPGRGPTFNGTERVHGQIGINETWPEAPLHVVSEFYEGGPTVVIENANEAGAADIAVDFQAAGNLLANIGMTDLGPDGNRRFFILGNNPTGLNLTLVEEGGVNVGVGTSLPAAPLHIRSDFDQGGPTLIVENANATGDVAIDFRSAEQLLGNIAVIGREVNSPRLAILQSSDLNMPLTLAENGGNVGIGTSNPQASLHINFGYGRNTVTIGDGQKGFHLRDTGGAVDFSSLGSPLFVNSDTRHPTYLNPYGGIVAIGTSFPPNNILSVVHGPETGPPIANAWTIYSSSRWKTNIEPIEGALDKVRHLRGVSFDWKKNGTHDIGLIGEEVGQVIPEVVAYEENHKDAKSVDYSRLVALLIEAIKEQQNEIDELKAALKSPTVKSEGQEAQSVAVRHQ